MGLPQGWDGIFFGARAESDMLFDFSPEELVAGLARYEKQGPFLTAGAITDLLIHDADSVRAIDILRLAAERWSQYPWMLLAHFATLVRTGAARGEERHQTRSGIDALVRGLFNAASLDEATAESEAVAEDVRKDQIVAAKLLTEQH